MPSPCGQGNEPTPLIPTLPFGQNVAAIGQIIENDADLRGLELTFPAFLCEQSLLVQELSQNGLIEVFEHQWLLLLIAHFLEIFT